MKQIQKILVVGLLALGSWGAHADMLSIACYSRGHGLSVYVEDGVKGFSAHYSSPGIDLPLTSMPNSWGERNSYTKVKVTPAEIRVVAQVLTGNVMDPVFDASIDLTLKFNAASNHYYIHAVKLYRFGNEVPVLPFTSEDSCYVQ